jgi:hypothetical protein
MVYMQVGAQNRINAFTRIACSRQILQKVGLQMRPIGNVALFIVTYAGVHENPASTGVYDQCVDAHNQITLLVHEVGLHPLYGLTRVPCGIGQNKARPARCFHFDNPGDFHITYLPLIHNAPPTYLNPQIHNQYKQNSLTVISNSMSQETTIFAIVLTSEKSLEK